MITLNTLVDATAQEVFDQVATHLLTQQLPSFDASGFRCAYRGVGPNNETLMCAAGCLISDDEYDPKMDSDEYSTGWWSLVDGGLVPNNHQSLIGDLQIIHDVTSPSSWLLHLSELSEVEGLSKDVLDKFQSQGYSV